MSRTFLLADDIHIKKRNFASLFTFCEPRGISFVHDKGTTLSKNLYGNYTDIIIEEKIIIESIPEEDLYNYKHRDINVFNVARAEMLSYLVSFENWQNGHFGLNSIDVFNKALRENKNEVILNMAAAMHWIEYWYHKTRSTPRLTYVGIFSGSLSYAKALSEIMKYRQGRVFVLESFFTGKHYYCEEKYGPIANLSDIRHKTVLNSIKLPDDQIIFDSKKKEVLNIIANMQNKNVSQPLSTGGKVSRTTKTLLILGQVVNDFSLLEVGGFGISSLAVYDEVITSVLSDTEYEIIFKAHPWEHKKHNLYNSITLQYLSARYRGNARIHFVENYAINDLFAEAKAVLVINSQSGLEAALKGFKTIVVGNAFYGNNGFTHDINDNMKIQIPKLLNSGQDFNLNIQEYDSLMEFLIRCIDGWLVAEHGGNSERRLKEIFFEVSGIKPTAVIKKIIESSKPTEINKTSGTAKKKLKKLLRDPVGFFRDARFSPLRKISKVITKGTNAN